MVWGWFERSQGEFRRQKGAFGIAAVAWERLALSGRTALTALVAAVAKAPHQRQQPTVAEGDDAELWNGRGPHEQCPEFTFAHCPHPRPRRRPHP